MTAIADALPSYELGGELGRGAMGEVLGGRHRRLDRDVAIKRLPSAFAEQEDVRERFAEEGRVLASLAHPHIVPVYDYVEDDGLCLLVMEALPGGTLWDRQTNEGLAMPSSCAAVLAACSGLAYAHDHHVLHRDVKPENLMFDGEETLKVTDFGIAKVFGGEETLATVDGEVFGTPAYMAPEQASGGQVGPLADVYSLATVLYELMSGVLPFDLVDDPKEFLAARVSDDPRPLSEVAPHVPEPLAAVTMDGLARRPEDRHQSAEDFGVAVGAAATMAWGSEWMDAADMRLLADGAIARSTQRFSADIEGRAPGATPDEGGVAPPAAAPGSERVRAEAVARPEGPALSGLDVEDLVPLHEILRPPPFPSLAVGATVVFALLLAVVAVLGLGSPDRQETLVPGQVALNGEDVAQGTVDVDLADRITATMTDLPDDAADAEAVEMRLSAAGVPLGTSTAGTLEGTEVEGTEIGAKSLRVITGGTMTAELRFLDDGGAVVYRHEFGLRSGQSWYLTAAALAGLTILLFVVAYAGSVAQPLWLGRERRSSGIALTWLGGLLGLAVVLLAWSAGAGEPTGPGVAAAALLGAAMGGTGGWALYRARRRSRLLDHARPDAEIQDGEPDGEPGEDDVELVGTAP